MTVIAIEEHWTTAEITRAQQQQPERTRDESLLLNDRGDIQARLEDIGEGRIETMDAAGIDMAILSTVPPGAHGLPPAEAVALSRDANDRVAEAIQRFPSRLRALMTLPMSDPQAALAELERCATIPGHVGIMSYGRNGDTALDDPANDEVIAAAARLKLPIFIHPQIPRPSVRDASYRGFDPITNLGLATFGWGWHIEAGIAALRLIVRGTFDRHPGLQIVLGHWGEMLLFASDRIDALSNVTHLDRPVAQYMQDNVHITASGMLTPRLLRHALDYTTADRILLSGDYPFHRLNAQEISTFLNTLPDPTDREQITHRNARALFNLETQA
jgi:predicted TIM-barrel fold metal-dependent hydrolase